MGKNGVKGEVVMRNGKILGWAWGAGFVDGIGQGMERASQPAVGLGATASVGAGDVLKMGIGGGASKAAQTLSEYYIKRAEQYHPVIPIGAGNEVTVVFQDGFQLKTIEELEAEKNGQQQAQNQAQPEQPESRSQQSGGNLNGFNTDEMLKKLGKLDPREFSPGLHLREKTMVKSLITLVLSTLRWTHWLVQYAVVYPLGMMMLLVVVVFWTGHNTPGQMLVKTIESVQREGYVIHDCTGPASREALNGDAVKPLLSPVLQEACTTVSTDATGYAAHIDQGYTKNILWLWLLMAMVFTGGSIVIGSTPRTGVTGY
jgi:hypothetical protein